MSWRRAVLFSAIATLILAGLLTFLSGGKAYGLFLFVPLILAARRLKKREQQSGPLPDAANNRPIHPK